MGKSIAKGVFYLVAAIMLLWTASLTYQFVSGVLPNSFWLVPLFSLVVFDGGMIAWLVVFVNYAEGSGQRAVAIVATLFDFIGVGLMALAEIFLGGQTIAAAPAMLGEYAIWGVGIWTVANVGAVLTFHLLAPDTRQKMALQAEKDQVFTEALEKLTRKRAAISDRVSNEMADDMLGQLLDDLGQRQNGAAPTAQRERVTAPLSENGHR